MQDDDQGMKPLVIDTSTTADETAGETESSEHTDVDQDAGVTTQLSATSQSSPVIGPGLTVADGSEFCDEEDDRGDLEDLSERHPDESVSSDSQSTVGSPSKDLTGSVSAGDLSPGPARCSKSRRKADRVRTTLMFVICQKCFYRTNLHRQRQQIYKQYIIINIDQHQY